MTRLWLLERREDLVGWDDTEGFVIRAPDEAHARRLARRRAWDHGRDWLDSDKATCREIDASGPVRVILQANRRG